MADNYTFKDASGNTQTHASKDVGAGVQATRHIDVDESNTAIAKAEDAAHVSGDKGYMLLAVRKDTAAALAGSDGDYIPLITDSSGKLYVNAGTFTAAGDVAHDAADSGSPVKIGGKAVSTLPSAVAASDRVNAAFDLYGRQITLPHAAIYEADDINTVSAGDVGYLRMTQYRGLIVSPEHLRAQFFSNSAIANPTDIQVGTANWYTPSGGPTTAFFDGSDGSFDANARYIHIPMYRFSRGAQIGIFNNLGVSMTIALRTRITSYSTSNAANGWAIYNGSLPNATYMYFSPLPLSDTVDSTWNYVPQLAAPMESLIIAITPASDPSSGYFILTVAR